MVVFENFTTGYDGVTKKIINYHLAKTFKDATQAAKEYIKRFFPKEEYNIKAERNGNEIFYVIENKQSLGNSRDVEFIAIYEQEPKSFEDFIKTFDKYQEAIDKRHREVMGISEFDFVIEK